MTEKTDIYKCQKSNIRKMLYFNSHGGDDEKDLWKVLIFDRKGRAIISHLFNLQELRECGVTLHLNLDSEKEPVKEVDAVYFIEANYSNLDLFLKDIKKDLYRNYHLNFVSTVSTELLTYLAKQSNSQGVSDKIKSVFDQYSNFFCFEPMLFTLALKNSYSKSFFNKELLVDLIVDGLFDVFVTLKSVPIIKAKKDTVSETVARRLTEKIFSYLDEKDNLFDRKKFLGNIFQRPVLILADRAVDFSVMLHHTSTYQALVYDLLPLHSNRVAIQDDQKTAAEGLKGDLSNPTLMEKAPAKNSATTFFDLDVSDAFWIEHKGSPFIQVAEAVHAMVNDYRLVKEGFEKKSSESSSLMNTIGELPSIRNKKILTDKHTSIAGALSKELNERNLAEFFMIEENLMLRQNTNRKKMENLLKSDGPRIEDKLRLLLIYIFSVKRPDINDIDFFESLLSKCLDPSKEADNQKINLITHTIAAAKKLKGLESKEAKLISKANRQEEGKSAISSPRIGSFNFKASTHGKKLLGSLMDKGAQLFSEVKNLIPPSRLLPLARVIDRAMRGSDRDDAAEGLEENESLVVLDPKHATGGRRRIAGSFRDAIVFVIGGGNYAEFQNLQDFAEGKITDEAGNYASRNIIYGCSEMIAPEEFLHEFGVAQSTGAEDLM